MKKIKRTIMTIAFAVIAMLSFTSCAVPAEAQVVVSNGVTTEVIVAEGIPFIVDGVISYYFWRDRYWYPYWHNGYRRFIPYDRPSPHMHHHMPPRPHHPPMMDHHHPHHGGHAGMHPRPPRPNPGSPRGHFGGRRH